MEVKEILGLDVGGKHTGIARASSSARLAEPLMSVPTGKVIEELKIYAGNNKLDAIAVGLPRNLKGNDTAQTTLVREWVVSAKEAISVPFYWQDEALTSRVASKLQTSKTKNHTFDEHSIAAAIILQDFLDSPEAVRMLA